MVLHALHLCSGYGGFELALRLAGVPARTVAHVERDSYAAALLVARMEEAHLDRAPVWSDLDTFDPAPWAGRVDLITAGFPCQPFSTAGQQRGVDDERWLWPSIGRIVRDVGPRLVFLENVPGLVRHGLPHVLSDLAQLGFDAEWGLHSAAEVGAPHQRDRIWLLAHTTGVGKVQGHRPRQGLEDRRTLTDASDAAVAHTDGDRLQGIGGVSGGTGRRLGRHPDRRSGPTVADADGARPERPRRPPQPTGTPLTGTGDRRDHQWPPSRDDHDGWREWIAQGGPQPAVRRGLDGRPPWLADALHAGGNGLVPAVAAAALVELARRLDVDLWGHR